MDLEQVRQAARLRSQPPPPPTNASEKHNSDDEEEVPNNEDHCFRCKRRGEIFCCDNCFRSFHAEGGCMSTRPTENIWSCPCCKLRDECPVCDAPIQEHDDSYVCSLCCRKTHYPCTGVPKSLLKPLSSELTFATESFFICYVCLYSSEIKVVVETEMIPDLGPYNLVVPYFCSSAHMGWISDLNIKNISTKSKKLKHSAASANQTFTPAILERIIGFKPPLIHQNIPTEQLVRVLRDTTRIVEPGHPNNFKFLVKWRDVEYQYSTWEDEFFVRQSPCNSLERFIRMKEYELHYLIEKSAQLKDFRVCSSSTEVLQPREQKLVSEIVEMYHKKLPVVLNKWTAERKCQTNVVGFIRHLFYREMVELPILVLAKHREFQTWLHLFEQLCPDMYVVNLTGLHDSRNVIKTRELYYEEAGVPKFDIMLTSFECLGKDNSMFYNKEINVRWSVIVYDDEMRCESYLMSRPGVDQSYRFILAKEFSDEEVRQVVNVLAPGGKPLPTSVEGDSMIKFVRQWIPHTFATEWSEYQPQPKFKMKLPAPTKKFVKGEKEGQKVQQEERFPSPPQLPEAEQKQPSPEAKPTKVPLPRGRRPKPRPPMSEPVVQPPPPPLQVDTKLPWPRYKRSAFLRFVLSFGIDFGSYTTLAEQLELFDKDIFENTPTMFEELKHYVQLFGKLLLGLTTEQNRKVMFRFEPSAIHRRITDIRNLRKAFFKYSPTPDKFSLGHVNMERSTQQPWKEREDLLLIQLILRHGYDNWQDICDSKEWKSDLHSERQPMEVILGKLGHLETVSAGERLRACCKNISNRASTIVEGLRCGTINLE